MHNNIQKCMQGSSVIEYARICAAASKINLSYNNLTNPKLADAEMQIGPKYICKFQPKNRLNCVWLTCTYGKWAVLSRMFLWAHNTIFIHVDQENKLTDDMKFIFKCFMYAHLSCTSIPGISILKLQIPLILIIPTNNEAGILWIKRHQDTQYFVIIYNGK